MRVKPGKCGPRHHGSRMEGKKKTAEFVSMNRIWLRENPTNEKIERNKGYLAINKLPYGAKDPCR